MAKTPRRAPQHSTAHIANTVLLPTIPLMTAMPSKIKATKKQLMVKIQYRDDTILLSVSSIVILLRRLVFWTCGEAVWYSCNVVDIARGLI